MTMARRLLSAWLLFNACSARVVQKLLAPPHPSASLTSGLTEYLPVVIWHGLGDNYEAEGLRSVGDLLNQTNPGTFTYYIHLDDDAASDRTATFLGNLTDQVEKVCADLASHPILSKAPAINAIGFSQGGQFLRGYIERCNHPRVANFVTFGSQHNGISEFQNCAENDWICYAWDGLLKRNTWTHLVQSKLVPAQYFRDPEDLETYLENSNFLADINNERPLKKSTYKENLKQLERFVMYMFSDDTVSVPKESAWFGEVNPEGKVLDLKDRDIYKEDWIGLRWLDERNRLEFRIAEGQHMQLSQEVLVDAFKKYFRP